MMCLGWNTKPTCDARPDVQLVAPASTCPDITWFWALAAAIGLGALVKTSGGRGKKEPQA
jgi:hypothetical protein